MRGFAFVKTYFGYRQNDRRGLLLFLGRPWWRWISLPQSPPLTQEEIVGGKFRWGRFADVHETGEPVWPK